MYPPPPARARMMQPRQLCKHLADVGAGGRKGEGRGGREGGGRIPEGVLRPSVRPPPPGSPENSLGKSVISSWRSRLQRLSVASAVSAVPPSAPLGESSPDKTTATLPRFTIHESPNSTLLALFVKRGNTAPTGASGAFYSVLIQRASLPSSLASFLSLPMLLSLPAFMR